MTSSKIIKAPCNECTRETDHDVLKMHKTPGMDEEHGAWWETIFEMIECRGCHFISLRRTFIFSEYETPVIEYFPPPVARRMPNWGGDFLLHVPIELDLPDFFAEVYSALHANNRRLAAMGARAILDKVIIHCIGDVGSFHQKLDAFE